MKLFALVAGLAFVSSAALAQPAPQPPAVQPFIPFEVTEQDAKLLRQYLDEQPMRISLPILNWMDQLEQRTIQAKHLAEEKAAKDSKEPSAKEEEKKAEEPPPAKRKIKQ